MDFDASSLAVNLICGAIGFAYLSFGRKQQHTLALVSGLGLMIFPYFVERFWLQLCLAAFFVILPFIHKIRP